MRPTAPARQDVHVPRDEGGGLPTCECADVAGMVEPYTDLVVVGLDVGGRVAYIFIVDDAVTPAFEVASLTIFIAG